MYRPCHKLLISSWNEEYRRIRRCWVQIYCRFLFCHCSKSKIVCIYICGVFLKTSVFSKWKHMIIKMYIDMHERGDFVKERLMLSIIWNGCYLHRMLLEKQKTNVRTLQRAMNCYEKYYFNILWKFWIKIWTHLGVFRDRQLPEAMPCCRRWRRAAAVAVVAAEVAAEVALGEDDEESGVDRRRRRVLYRHWSNAEVRITQ